MQWRTALSEATAAFQKWFLDHPQYAGLLAAFEAREGGSLDAAPPAQHIAALAVFVALYFHGR